MSKAEPALIAAQNSVDSIDRKQLDELKAMKNPPDKVKMAIESVVVLLENMNTKPEWKTCTKFLAGGDFIKQVLNFDKDKIAKKTKEFIKTNYLEQKDWETSSIYSASKVAGPIAEWVQSILEYADIYLNIEPMRKEVELLSNQQKELQSQYERILEVIQNLEDSIENTKREYAILISDVEAIKKEMQGVVDKCERS